MKDSKQYDSWYLETNAHAQIKDLYGVLDPQYIPIGKIDKLLFCENNALVYAVFAEVLCTDKGKSLVRYYELHWDTQKIYENLLAHTKISTKASV